MNTLQRTVERLLLETVASRAVLYLARPEGGFAIAAEAVQHGQDQIRHQPPASGIDIPDDVASAGTGPEIIVQPAIDGTYGTKARMLAPLTLNNDIIGVLALHHGVGPRQWSADDRVAMEAARSRVRDTLAHEASLDPLARADLRTAAVQAILDRLRGALGVQRCTFRQPVQEAYAFPVTFESRADGMRSLLGDFTIVQTGQPVIVRLLAERSQVVQDDCSIASADPMFHKMLAHYGGMRAQVVTPFIVGDALKGVLSVHELRGVRAWTGAEKALAAEAAALIGALFEVPQG